MANPSTGLRTGAQRPRAGHRYSEHTSPVRIRYMQTHKPPFRMVCPGKVYPQRFRCDALSDVSSIRGTDDRLKMSPSAVSRQSINALTRAYRSRKVEFRFLTRYFPFVEPGLEMDMVGETSKAAKKVARNGRLRHGPSYVLNNVGIDAVARIRLRLRRGTVAHDQHRIPDLRSFL